MFYISQNVRKALKAELWIPALFTALAGIDICSALSSENGETSGKQYKAWVEKHAPDIMLSPEDTYLLRCGMLHQGRHKGKDYARIAFTLPDPGNNIIHGNILDDTYNLDLRIFCEDICVALDSWWASNSEDATVARNFANTVQCRIDGAQYGISGIPVLI